MSRLLGTTRLWRLQLAGFSRHTRRYSALPLVYSEEVRQAKVDGTPIVALESTIITHGMPYPKNLETAREVEDIIRKQGATPATIAILKGELSVGLTKEQLEYLAKAKGVVKASRRDLAPVIAAQKDGATTVAGTIIAAELADIPVFVTGGIGGVHREGENTMDVSADLTELGRSKTLVVCSGVKSILDIGRTLEFLETQGVTVCSFGESDDFPAFYTTRSGYKTPNRATDPRHAARILHAARRLRLSSGIVIAVPVPEKYAMDSNVIETAIKNALVEASKHGISGKEVTPFLLAAVSAATGGASLDANIALIKNNAKVGADIAVQFQKLRNVDNLENAFNIGVSKSPGKCTTNSSRRLHTSCAIRIKGEENMINNDLGGDVLVIGGANVDRTYRVTEESVQDNLLESASSAVEESTVQETQGIQDSSAEYTPGTTDTSDATIKATSSSSHSSSRKRNSEATLTKDVLISVRDHFKRPALPPPPLKLPDDRFDVFGKAVAFKLRDLNKTQRILAEKIINETLAAAELGSLTTSHTVMAPFSNSPFRQSFSNQSYSPTSSRSIHNTSPYSNQQSQSPIYEQSLMHNQSQTQPSPVVLLSIPDNLEMSDNASSQFIHNIVPNQQSATIQSQVYQKSTNSAADYVSNYDASSYNS